MYVSGMRSVPVPLDLISERELMSYLDVGRTTMYMLRKDGLPCIQVRGQIRYSLPDVLSWLEAQKNK